ncbi:MAG TPA: SDR family NAD(P)-dependent oxidoreductase [Terriglobia bacterium]|nr:SDR family NAD(P)-dependent oxidoreductase [Terriglobia bacterium]
MPETIRGQVIIVTGASAGIGDATARLLASQGAHLVLVARRTERLVALKKELQDQNPPGRGETTRPPVLLIPADITSEADRQRIVHETLDTFQRIDALVNNAGYGQRGPIEIVSLEAIRANFEVNLFGLIGLTQLVAPVMRTQGKGRIINVSSVAGRIARPYSSIYDATKHALEAISDGLRGELSAFGIKVVLIEPGLILTEFMQAADQMSASLWTNPGPYAPVLQHLNKNQARARRIAAQPEVIARLILRGLTDRKPRLRYVAPFHAKIFLALKWMLPDRVFDSLVKRVLDVKPTQDGS